MGLATSGRIILLSLKDKPEVLLLLFAIFLEIFRIILKG